jgi:hypothetical protein
MAPANPPPPSNNHHHHHNANTSVGSGGSGCGNNGNTSGPPTPPPRVITNRHYFCNTISLKKNQSMLPLTEVVGIVNNGNANNNATEILKTSKVLTYLQDCLTIHRTNARLEKKIRQTLMLMSCLS